MDKEAIEKKVKELIAEQFGTTPDKLSNSSGLVSDLGADSLDGVELVMCLEDEFHIKIEDRDAQDFLTIQNVVDYIFVCKGNKNE